MRFWFCLLFGFLSSVSFQVTADTASNTSLFYRNFWYPKYHQDRLNYCTQDRQACGLAVAHHYCKMLGYQHAQEALIEYNVGLTRFIITERQCKGWQCNGFTLITCVGKFSHHPPPTYVYRLKRFVFPRLDHYRIDWCYQDKNGCGERAAYSFCRRMGYLQAKSYRKQSHISATKALGNQKMCFGNDCNGFGEIICYR